MQHEPPCTDALYCWEGKATWCQWTSPRSNNTGSYFSLISSYIFQNNKRNNVPTYIGCRENAASSTKPIAQLKSSPSQSRIISPSAKWAPTISDSCCAWDFPLLRSAAWGARICLCFSKAQNKNMPEKQSQASGSLKTNSFHLVLEEASYGSCAPVTIQTAFKKTRLVPATVLAL